MLIGYAITSTVEQEAGFEAQKRDLEAAGCKKVFSEQVSSVATRTQLPAALDYLRDDDVSSSPSSTGWRAPCAICWRSLPG